MDYLAVKHLHVSCVLLSISLFIWRGSLAVLGRSWRDRWLLRVAPHVVDTVLLASALWLAWRSAQYPWAQTWLAAKVLVLLAYIVLGSRALGRHTPESQRLPFFVAALLSVSYIVGVALTRSPSWGLLAG